jgi:hypothetical protein
MGATAEEWRSYQEQGMAATQEAVDLLQTRSLRDMKWLSNAKAKILAKLQREAAGKRKAVEREITDEVRAQPVYAAIRFLTHGELADEHRTNKERALLDSIAGQPSKLSIPDLKAMYGDHPAAPWRYLNTGKFGHLAAEDGLHPEHGGRAIRLHERRSPRALDPRRRARGGRDPGHDRSAHA